MTFSISPAIAFIAGFLIVLLFFSMPLIPAIFIFSSGYGGDGAFIEGDPPSDAQYASEGGRIIPDGEYLWPVPNVNRYTSGYGVRLHPIKQKWRIHYGVDIGAPEGTDIISVADGIVSFVGNKGGYGKTVIITHDDGAESLYGHCSKLIVKVNRKVRCGNVIAQVGSTGISTGSHLHFEIRINNNAIDPLPYISSGGW